MNRIARTMMVLSAALGLCLQASALSISDSRYLGSILDAEPSSPVNEVGFISSLISMAPNTMSPTSADPFYSRSGNVFALTIPTVVGGFDSPTNPDPLVDLGTGWTYLYAKYGKDAQVWFVGDLTGPVTIPADLGQAGGLSHFALFNPGTTVPDGGASVLLLGLGFLGLAAGRKLLR